MSGVAQTRFRCTACGNITRFDVTSTRTTRAFHHFTVGGELVVEEVEVLAESVDAVSCRWCGHGRGVEVLAEEDVPGIDPVASSTGRSPGATGDDRASDSGAR